MGKPSAGRFAVASLGRPLWKEGECPESLYRTRIAARFHAPQDVRNDPLSLAPGTSSACQPATPGTGGRSPAPGRWPPFPPPILPPRTRGGASLGDRPGPGGQHGAPAPLG